eukprot:SAG31_NODE_12594_length_930_cov_26.103490_2_plen_77_part_00
MDAVSVTVVATFAGMAAHLEDGVLWGQARDVVSLSILIHKCVLFSEHLIALVYINSANFGILSSRSIVKLSRFHHC